MTGIRQKIYQHSGDLNAVEKDVLNYLFNNIEESSQMSLEELSSKLYVSKSAIFRLSKKIGLSGFSELKYELSDLAKQKKIMDDTDFVDKFTKIVRQEENYFRSLDLDSFYMKLNNAKTIYLYSTGWQQQTIASYLSNQLLTIIGKPSVLLASAIDELKMSKNWVKEGDILFVISFSGNNKMICDELERLRLFNNNFVITSMSMIRENRLSTLSDYSLFFQPEKISKGTGEEEQLFSFSPAYIMVDLLVNGYLSWCSQ